MRPDGVSCLILRSFPPEIQRLVFGDTGEVPVRRQHGEIMPNTELREERIDRPDLHAASATGVSKSGRRNVVIPVGHEKRQSCETSDDAIARAGSPEALKQFLENEARRKDGLTGLQCPGQGGYFGACIR
jgi:hypothetical protein